MELKPGMTRQRAKTLALAGIFQSASLADSFAWRGHCDPVALEASLESILVLDTDNPDVIFGSDLRGLRVGLSAIEQTFFQPLRHPHPRQNDIVRYALALVHLEGKLRHSGALQQQLRGRLERARDQRRHFDSLKDPAMLRNLGGAYVDTLGSLDFRIQVRGDRKLLASQGTPEQVRAILLAGVRAAWLWHRLGGRRWHLVFTRNQVLKEIREIIRSSGT